MKGIIKSLIFLALVVLLIIVATAVFIGAGYFLSLILSLTLFQSSILCTGATFTLAFVIYTITVALNNVMPLDTIGRVDDEENDEDDYDGDYEDTESDDFSDRRFSVVNTEKVGRNKPCPCGSGKKYKYCCGKKK